MHYHIQNTELILNPVTKQTEILCEDKIVDIRAADHIIINGDSAPPGNSYCPIYIVGSNHLQTEVHQCKPLNSKKITNENFIEECKKATDQNDIFILYTVAELSNSFKLPPMSAIIYKKNWKNYFAERCFNYIIGPPDINSITYTQLTGIQGIGKTYAKNILIERKKCPFSNIDDCSQRTKIPCKILEPFF